MPQPQYFSRAFLLLAGMLLLTPFAHGQDMQTLPQWNANPALASSLAAETVMDKYGLRLPTGYIVYAKQQTSAGGLQIQEYMLKGHIRPDGTFPAMIVLVSPAPTVFQPSSANLFLDNIERNTLQTKPNLVVSKREFGQINGLSAAREFWKYDSRTAHHLFKMHGFFYLSINGSGSVGVTGMDAEPYNQQSLPIIEAAAMTLREAHPPTTPSVNVATAPWTPDSALLNQLASETQVNGYTLRPPSNYTLVQFPGVGGVANAWKGAQHPDGTTPVFILQSKSVEAGTDKKAFATAVLKSTLLDLQRVYTNVKMSNVEVGQINDLPAERFHFTGTRTRAGKQSSVAGFLYFIFDASSFNSIEGLDGGGGAMTSLQLLNAAALTFHK